MGTNEVTMESKSTALAPLPSPHPTRALEVEAVRQKILALRTALGEALLEREVEIDSLLTCALAGEHIVLIGPPGTAKSLLARSFAGALGGRYFEALLTRFSTPEELFGPFSLAGLQADRFTRAMDGKFPTADVAFLDEIFKAGPSLLNSLLGGLNERVMHDDGKVLPIPLRVCIGASNEYPQSEETMALWDRYMVRHEVSPLAKSESQLKLAMGVLTRSPMNVISLDEWDLAARSVREVTVPKGAAEAFLRVVTLVRADGVYVSDRRMVKALSLVKATAWLDGSSEIDSEHFGILEHALWEKTTQRGPVAGIVRGQLSPLLGEAQRLRDACMTVVAPLVASSDSTMQARALTELKRAALKIKELGAKMKQGTRSRERVRSLFVELSTLHKDTLAKAAESNSFDGES